MTDAKPRKARTAALVTCAAIGAWLLGVWPPPVWWRSHWPRQTAMMRASGASFRPLRLEQISPTLQRMVIIGEDSRFWTHHGIDFAELADALGIDHGVWATVRALRRVDRLRGASTITQQLAKNLYLSPARSLPRKLKEAVTALRLEAALPKTRILELYLSVAEWGPGVWGIDAASRTYYGVPAAQLGEEAAATLAATLPHPRSSNPRFRPERTLARRDLILARYHGVTVSIPAEEEDTTPAAVPAGTPPAESLGVTSPDTAPIAPDTSAANADTTASADSVERIP